MRSSGTRAAAPNRTDFDYGDLAGLSFPYMFNVDQVITERVLRGHARR